MKTYGVVVVTYNSQADIGRCLDSLAAAGAPEVVVIDNASTDGTVAEAASRPGVRVVANPWNRGFAAAANQGIELVRRDLVLLLNPDTVVRGGLEMLAQACQQPGVAAAGGRLIGQDGRIQAGFMVRRLPAPVTLAFEALGLNRLWPGNPVNTRYRCAGFNAEQPAEVEQPAGAFIMLRRDAWRALGGFDETFFPLWFEDVDFCKRAAETGYRVCYVPSAVAVHTGGYSARKLSTASRWTYWYGTLLWYSARHFRPAAVRAISGAVMLGVLLRAVAACADSGAAGPAAGAVSVLKLAGRYLWSAERSAGGFPAFGFYGAAQTTVPVSRDLINGQI